MGQNIFPVPTTPTGIKNVQRGTGSFTTANPSTVNITISSVNTSKAFINFFIDGSASSSTNENSGMAQLTSSTNLQVTQAIGTTNAKFSWEVVEFN